MRYHLHDRPPIGVTILTSLQWLIVTLSSSIVVPLVIGDVYGLDAGQTSKFMQQTLFFVGLASLLQVWFGHRLPIMEASAGLWWGIFLILAQIGFSMGQSPWEVGQSLQTGMLLAGCLFLLLGAGKWLAQIRSWFTPIVTGVFTTLLAISLTSTFVKGMLGLGFQQAATVQPKIMLASLVIVVCVQLFTRIPAISSFAVLIGMACGWVMYALLGWTEPMQPVTQLVVWPSLFFWGPPGWDGGIIITSLITGFVLLTNLIAGIVVVSRAVQAEVKDEQFNRGGFLSGINHLLAGLSGVVAMVPLTLAGAVIESSKIASRLPFIIGMFVLMLIGLIPAIPQFMASMPAPVAYAAMFIVYTQLLAFGLRDFARVEANQRNVTIIGASLLLGIGVMFIPSEAWQSLHPLMGFLLGNGLLLGVMLSLLLEHLLLPRQKERKKGPTAQ